MPVTVHKVLVHGASVIKHAILPIDQLAEDAQESRHKEIRKYRESNGRKYCRKATMQNVINMLFVTSDPLINSFRKKPQKVIKNLSPEVLLLLI